jgi:hypothetical protein
VVKKENDRFLLDVEGSEEAKATTKAFDATELSSPGKKLHFSQEKYYSR